MKFVLKLMTVSYAIGSSVSFAQAITYNPAHPLYLREGAVFATTVGSTTVSEHVLERFPSVLSLPYVDSDGFNVFGSNVDDSLARRQAGWLFKIIRSRSTMILSRWSSKGSTNLVSMGMQLLA